MECQGVWVLQDPILYSIHLKMDLRDTESLVYPRESTDGASVSIQMLSGRLLYFAFN